VKPTDGTLGAGARLADALALLESIAPETLAEQWDNVGLQIGDPRALVRTVMVALDPSPAVIDHACAEGIDLLVTHHPLFFRPVQKIELATPLGGAVARAIRGGLAVACLHTNLDAAADGLNDMLAARLGLSGTRPLAPIKDGPGAPHGLGRVGELDRAMPLRALAADVKARLGSEALRLAGNPELAVRRVAVCAGSGGSLLAAFFASDAQVFVSGDLRYHEARAVEEAGRGLIDVGHFHSEHLVKEALAERLRDGFAARGHRVEVRTCPKEKDPFSVV
jgi:dinuclear metal center YbgI/SA1388 family protein